MPFKGIVFVLSDRWQVSRWQENVNVPKGTIKSRRKYIFSKMKLYYCCDCSSRWFFRQVAGVTPNCLRKLLVKLFCESWGDGLKWQSNIKEDVHEATFLKLDCSKIKRNLKCQSMHIQYSWTQRMTLLFMTSVLPTAMAKRH